MARADDFLLTTEELRLRRRKRRRLVLLGGIVLALGLGIFFGGRPSAGAIKAWQSRRHAARVPALLSEEKWTEARREAMAAYQLRPNEPEAIRAVARYLSRTRQQEALQFWDELAQKQPLTRDDLREETSIALLSGETPRAETAMARLLQHGDAGPADWFLEAQLSMQKAELGKAQDDLGKVLESNAASGRERLKAALMQLSLTRGDDPASTTHRAQALDQLKKLAEGKDSVGLDALVILAQSKLESRKEKGENLSGANVTGLDPEQLAHALENHPLARAPQKLLALDLLAHAHPEQRDALVRRGIDQWRTADADGLAALAVWLNGKGEYERELDAIPLQKALETKDLFLQRLDALGALGRWTDIKQLLESEQFSIDTVIQRMYLARCNTQLGEKTAAANNWQRALEAAVGDAQKSMMLAGYAEKNGELLVAEAAYTNAAAIMPGLRAAHEGRLHIAQAERHTKKMHDILVEMRERWPNDTAIQNDEAYTRLLLLSSRNDEARNPKSDDASAKVTGGDSGKGGNETRSAEGGVRNEGEGEKELPSSEFEMRNETSPVGSAIRNPHSTISSSPSDVPTFTPSNSSSSASTNSQLPTPNSGDGDGEKLDAIEKLAEKLVQREPTSLPHRTLLALARLKQHRPAAALEAYADIRVSPGAVTPSALAVHAAVLAANDQREDARRELEQVPADRLLPEEEALVADLKAKEKVEGRK